jgi:hypothetical protein
MVPSFGAEMRTQFPGQERTLSTSGTRKSRTPTQRTKKSIPAHVFDRTRHGVHARGGTAGEASVATPHSATRVHKQALTLPGLRAARTWCPIPARVGRRATPGPVTFRRTPHETVRSQDPVVSAHKSRRPVMSGDSIAPEPMSEDPHDLEHQTPPGETPPAQSYTQFETFIPAKYELPLDLQAAVLSDGESIASWLGPVNKLGGSDISSHYVRTSRSWSRRSVMEVDRDAVNTFLFTNNQIIGLMLGPDDLQYLRYSGPVKTAANEAIAKYQWSREGALAKGVQFASLNANHWKEMVDALSAQPLSTALGDHLNCGLPYDRVQSVKVKSRFINPGLTIYLTDGSYLIYGTFGKKGRLPEVASFLGEHVKQQ